MKKKLPALKSDEEAEEFVANSDLTEYDLSGINGLWGILGGSPLRQKSAARLGDLIGIG